MTKKFLTLTLAVVLALACGLSAAAGWCDSVFLDTEFTALATYGTDVLGTYQMRGFAVDPNGKYYFGGNLQGGPTMYKFNTKGEMLDSYQFQVDPGSYVKAIACDDRGYVYNGIANAANNGAFFFSICEMETLKEVSYVEVAIDGKIGVNGVGVANMDGKYVMALTCNYDTNRVYFFDVTDVTAPKEMSWFDIPEKLGMSEGANCGIDSKGNVYVAGKDDGLVIKCDMAGNVLEKVEIPAAWGLSVYEDEYIVVGNRNKADSMVYVLDAEDLTIIGEYVVTKDIVDSGFSGAGIMGDRIYACDHSKEDTVYVSKPLGIPAKPVPVVETEAEVVDDAGTEAPAGTSTAPATFDMTVVAAAAAIVSAAGYAVSKKR